MTGIFDNPAVPLCINASWAGHIDGLLDQLTDRRSWQGTEEEVDYAVGQIQKLMVAIKATAECEVNVPQVYPENFYIDALSAEPVDPLTVVRTVNAGFLTCHTVSPGSIAQNNAIQLRVFARKGVYLLTALGQTTNNKGISTIRVVGGADEATMDWYSAVAAANVFKTASLDFENDGEQVIKIIMATKNAASANYDLALQFLQGLRTGDLP